MATQSIIEQNIQKYAKGDDAYANKLKTGIRDAMGYSNYMAKLGNEAARPASIGDISGLSPAGIKERIGSKFGMQRENINSLERITGGIDTAAGQIANSQVSAANKANSATGFENGIAFSPTNPLEEDILSYMQNPKNPDGSVKSLQQFEEEMKQKWKSDRMNDATPIHAFNPDEIKTTIESRVPKDFIGNEDKYHLMAQGYSEKQASELQGALNYDTMSEPERLIYQVKNPTMAKSLEEGKMSKELISDIGVTTDPETGQTTPKYTFDELAKKYPNVSETELKDLVKPVEQKSLQDDVNQWFTGKLKDAATKLINSDKEGEGYSGFMSDPKYKEFKTKLSLEYGKVFSDREIDQLIYNTIRTTQ